MLRTAQGRCFFADAAMKFCTNITVLACLALASSALAALAWIGCMWTGSLQSTLGLVQLAAFATSVALAVVIARRARGEQQQVERALDMLCKADSQLLASGDESYRLPEISSSWTAVYSRLRERLVECTRRLEEAEQSRAALEIRSRRNEARSQKISSILASLSEPVIAVDGYDELVLANRSAEKLFAISPENTQKRALGQLLRCEKLVELLSDTRRRKAPAQRTGELEIADSEGRSQWYSVTTRSLEDAGPDGSTAHGAVAVLRDISFQKAIQKRNAQFVSDVSHEMKTPLAGIKAYVELLLDGEASDDAEREEFLNVISSQANRLQRLVDNLLNLARIEAGVVSVSKQSRSLNEVLDEACQVIQPSADAKNIRLVVDLSPLYLGVLADRDMLLQTAINLLSNAVKYTHEGGQITLRSRSDDAAVCFEVEDTGVGLGPEDVQKVFEKFYRVQKDKEMAAGTGLGLPLAKHIVEDVHGGKLTVRSTLGRGSTFTVMLPTINQLHRAEAN